MKLRIQKINKLIKQQVAEIIKREINFKTGVFVTISKVDTTNDIKYTRVFVSVFPEKELSYAQNILKQETAAIQRFLNEKMFCKPLPKIRFIYDETETKADQVEKILHLIKKEKSLKS